MLTAALLIGLQFRSVKLTMLPEYPKTPQPHPYSISADGKTVVGQFAPGQAFLWRGGETARFKPNPNQSVLDTYAQSTNADGSIIVGKAGVAYRYGREIGFHLLGKLEGDIDSFAYDVSSDGSVIVGYSQASTLTRAFVWTKEGGLSEIPAPEPNKSSIALAVSANGKVACGISTDNSVVRAFRTDFETSSLLPIGNMHTDSSAYDVSADGQIVVGSAVYDDGSRAVYWRNDQIYFLPNMGQRQASAKCISPDGAYIGGNIGDDAVIWHKQQAVRLEGLVNKPGWSFESINGITHVSGKVILTGWGAFRGKSVGYHLVLSE